MKRQYRSGSDLDAASMAMMQMNTLITGLSRGVQLLDSEIDAEEERTGCRDRSNPAYSSLACSLTARRDNLSETVAVLRERLEALDTAAQRRRSNALEQPEFSGAPFVA